MSSIQPILPPEDAMTDAELYFIGLQPKNLWPTNQNSNLGLLRKLLTDLITQISQTLDELESEMFVSTTTDYMAAWERELGLPEGQGGRTVAQRRAVLLARRRIGPFTRSRRNAVIEEFIADTFGVSLFFGGGGIILTDDGAPLFADIEGIEGTYVVYEDIQNFSYEIFIRSDVTPDIESLTREMDRLNPAHYSYIIDNTLDEILNFYKAIIQSQPVLYLPDYLAHDLSGYDATVATSVDTFHDSLLDPAVADGTGGAYNLVAADEDFISVTYQDNLKLGNKFTIEFLINLTSLPDPGEKMVILSKGDNQVLIYIDEDGYIVLEKQGTSENVHSITPIVVGQTWHCFVTVEEQTYPNPDGFGCFAWFFQYYWPDDVEASNGSSLDGTSFAEDETDQNLEIGRSTDGDEYLDAVIDQIAIYNRTLGTEEIEAIAKTANNVFP